jgi:opacity protein-like surface antigen
MQKALLATAVALTLSAVSLTATAASNGPFVRLETGKAHYGVDDHLYDSKSARSFGVTGGYRWQVTTPFALGVEAGYMNLGNVKYRHDNTVLDSNGTPHAYSTRNELGMRAFLVGANGRFEFAKQWSLTGRLGMAHTRTRFAGETNANLGSSDYRGNLVRNTAYAGVGVNYALSRKIDVGLNMTRYSSTGTGFAHSDNRVGINTFGATMEARF